MKKKLWIGVGAAALLVVAALIALQVTASRFSDVSRRDARYPYLDEVTRRGLMSVRADGSFGVDESVTVEETMNLLLRAIGAQGELAQAAVEHRLVYAFDEGALERPATRLETAQMAARALDLLPLAGKSPYADCDDAYVVKLYERGLWQAGERFLPLQPVTRGELAQLLWHMLHANLSQGAIRYSNYWVETLEGVPLYDLEEDSFVLTEDGPDYAGTDYTTLRGVDVSGYQGDIDWERVKADGIDFAIVRVGGRFMQSGDLYDDSYFQRNMEGALAAGLQVGVYFFSQAVNEAEGLEEAEYVLERLGEYALTMPVIIDWEYLGGATARTYGAEPEAVTAAIAAFCRRVEEAGYRAGVYFNSYCGYIKMDLRALTDYAFWFAQYSQEPDFLYQFSLWQYTNAGTVDGISGAVDMNLYLLPM